MIYLTSCPVNKALVKTSFKGQFFMSGVSHIDEDALKIYKY